MLLLTLVLLLVIEHLKDGELDEKPTPPSLGEGIFGNDYFPDWFSNNERVLDFKRSVFGSIKLVDILHLYNVGERSNWEWRGGRVAWAMTSRVVVSEDFKDYLIDVVRGGR